ncbi:MAG: hypothetical protein BIFFINMI_01278 [Phycisphaerae bacterium]|nr:hypothetical protein [Phycisphaerae bacterium]
MSQNDQPRPSGFDPEPQPPRQPPSPPPVPSPGSQSYGPPQPPPGQPVQPTYGPPAQPTGGYAQPSYAPGGYAPAYTPQPQTSMDGLALASFILSLIICVPGLGLLGLLLGIPALFTSGKPGKRGRGLAIAGVILGTLISLGWAGIAGITYYTLRGGLSKADAAIARFVEDYNSGDYDRMYQRMKQAEPSITETPEDFRRIMTRQHDEWGDAVRIRGFWPMMSRGGLHVNTVNDMLEIRLPFEFKKAGDRMVRLTFRIKDGRLELIGFKFNATSDGD